MKLQPKLAAKHVLTQMLHRSLEILQLPQIELAALVLEEVEKNPLLELESGSVLQPFVGAEPVAVDSFHERLWAQMREALPGQEAIGEKLIIELDERGFLTIPATDLSAFLQIPLPQLNLVLQKVKTFDPPGLFASNLQEAFLLQLERLGQEKTLGFRIVQERFADLLAGRYAVIKKKFRVSSTQLQEAIQQIARLKTRPIDNDHTRPLAPIYPDFRVEQIDGAWVIEIMEDAVPKFRWNERCVQMYSSCPAMRSFKATAKWLFRSIQRRKDLLASIAKYLARKQGAFFEGCEEPKQLSARALAVEFGVHESTIFRAIAGKYVESPRGIIPLRLLVTAPPNRHAKEMLRHLIEKEPFLEPLTDEKLAFELEKSGHKVARRTIAKYRKQLNIGAAFSRKHLI